MLSKELQEKRYESIYLAVKLLGGLAVLVMLSILAYVVSFTIGV